MTRFGAKENFFYGSLLYSNPKVIWCKTWSISERVSGKTNINPIVEIFANEDVIWAISVGWLANDALCKSIIDGIYDMSPRHKVIFLVNSYEEIDLLRKKKINCLLVNQNQFLNKNDFNIINELPKKYNAVYNAGFFEYKRHFLAKKIKNLALISRGTGDAEIFNEIKNMEDVNLLNFNDNNYNWMNSNAINHVYNESYCGLCLSKTEGAMKACMEYLLSGIPVVTTVNRGGRDFFLDGRFTIWVDDNPDSVSNAVDCFVNNRMPPELIRNETISKINKHNEYFIKEFSEIFGLDFDKLQSGLLKYNFNISTERHFDEFK